MQTRDYDFLVIGSGLAGLVAAWNLREYGKVFVATKQAAEDSNSTRAQGGIACAITAEDSVETHISDTLSTGQGLCIEPVVREILSGGADAIRELENLGVHFNVREGFEPEYDLGKEGGHSKRRVLHIGDITGEEIIRVLLGRVEADPNIELQSNLMAIDLVTSGWLKLGGRNRCLGAYFLNRLTGEISAVRARCTVLATGGAGKVYLYTSNPDIATGDGVAMAWRAGVPIRNMEFVQFHPTCLYHPDAKSFLISEAVRGEGGVLVTKAGDSFTEAYDPRGSLAPRDIVARAIDNEMKRLGDECVYLDITSKSEDFLRKRFPNIFERCLRFGVDMSRDLIPVVPAAHYFCGGIMAGVDGATAMPGLRAIGEVASTGLHGANRLASNSLLEAVVCALKTSQAIMGGAECLKENDGTVIPEWHTGDAVPSDEAVVVEHNWNEVRTAMWDYVGIVRTDKRLERAAHRITNLRREIRQYYFDYLVTADVLELRNIAAVAELIVRSASQRKESRGLHYTLDYPDAHPERARDTIIQDRPGGPINPSGT